MNIQQVPVHKNSLSNMNKIIKFLSLLKSFSLLISIRSESTLAHDLPPGSDPHGNRKLLMRSASWQILGRFNYHIQECIRLNNANCRFPEMSKPCQ